MKKKQFKLLIKRVVVLSDPESFWQREAGGGFFLKEYK